MNPFCTIASFEVPGVTAILFLFFGLLALAAATEYLGGLYHLLVRRYERTLDDSYSATFEMRATEARILNANVGYALLRAKRTIEQARKISADEIMVWVALGQVSDWLNCAAETSDRALRSLGGERKHSAVSSRNFHEQGFE